jgi:hypothetical protein
MVPNISRVMTTLRYCDARDATAPCDDSRLAVVMAAIADSVGVAHCMRHPRAAKLSSGRFARRYLSMWSADANRAPRRIAPHGS